MRRGFLRSRTARMMWNSDKLRIIVYVDINAMVAGGKGSEKTMEKRFSCEFDV
jgi:hypothetical protein